MTREVATPQWVYDGFLMLQAAESVQFGYPNGFATVETPKNIQERLDPQMANRLSDQGVGFVILGGPIGAGMKEDLKIFLANKPLAQALKAKGIRRVLYVNTIGMIFSAPFFAEHPDAVNWVQRTSTGERPIYYTNWQYFIPCLNNDHFMAYTRSMLKTVMKEMEPDGIFTDNYGYYSYSCFCDHCQTKFREYLYKKYPDPQSREDRFGFSSPLDYVTPPPFRPWGLGNTSPHTGIPDTNLVLEPLTQEWIRFRCQRLGQVTSELNQVIKECNPNAIFFVNYVYGGAPGINCAVFHGLWPEFVYPHSDLISAEVAGPPSIAPGGAVQGRNLLMKVAKHYHIPLSTCSSFGLPLKDYKRIYLAEGIAFNTAPIDLIGEIKRENPPQWMRDYRNFYEKNKNRIGHASTVADCAVLHNFETLSFTYTYPQESLVLCEQSLIQGNITFDIIFDRDIDRLDNYRCLFLANVLSMSESLVKKIVDYIHRGGAVIATEDTSALNERMLPWKGEWLKLQKSRLLADLLKLDWPKEGLVCRQIGQGRVVFLAEIKRPWNRDAARGEADQTQTPSPLVQGSHSCGPDMPMLTGTPALAMNHREILEAVDYSLQNRRTIRIEGPENLVAEVTRNDKGYFVHLLNWREDQPVTEVKVSVRLPDGDRIETIELLSPDRETASQILNFVTKNGYAEFLVPNLLCYNIFILK
ncbi:MAG: hypothetical protein WC975_16470 [Phycisphaerae bacterium]